MCIRDRATAPRAVALGDAQIPSQRNCFELVYSGAASLASSCADLPVLFAGAGLHWLVHAALPCSVRDVPVVGLRQSRKHSCAVGSRDPAILRSAVAPHSSFDAGRTSGQELRDLLSFYRHVVWDLLPAAAE